MQVFLGLVVALIAVLVAKMLLKMYKMNQYVRNVPKLPRNVFIEMLFKYNRTAVETLKMFRRALDGVDGLSKFWIGTKLTIVVDDPENMKLILMSKNCVHKPYIYRLIGGGGEGIFTSQGDRWKNDRKRINTVFTPGILRTFIPVFNRHFTQFTSNLEKHLDRPEVDMMLPTFSCNLDIVCENTLRFDLRSQCGNNEDVVEGIARNWEISEARVTNLLLHPDFIYRFTNLCTEQKGILEHFVDIAPSVLRNVDDLRATDESNRCENMASCDDTSPKSMILIDKLVEMKQKGQIDQQGLIDQIHTFVAAGTDTSSVTMLNIFMMLAIHQDVQERVYKEICDNIHDLQHLDYDALSKLDYMECAIKETMRLIPLGPFLPRETDADIQLTDCVVPKGALFFLNVLKMHRNKEIWGTNADEYDPDRFLPESMANRHPFAYLPFSAGPRNCIGTKYAMISMKVMLCHLLTAFKLTTRVKMTDIVLKFELIMKMDNKCLVKLERRQRTYC